MTTANSHILTFIQDYISRRQEPEYALLIDGPWGSGKTSIVKQAIKECEIDATDGKRILYVSLYGVTALEDIEMRILRAYYPLLRKRAPIFMSAQAIHYLGINTQPGNAIDIARMVDWLKSRPSAVSSWYHTKVRRRATTKKKPQKNNSKQLVLVFDDLERAQMDLQAVLGYINTYVEHESLRAILVADRENIAEDRTGSKEAIGLLEKVVGKTLVVQADAASVYDKFLTENVETISARSILTKHRNTVLAIFEQSGYSNLRSLKRTMLEVDHLWSHLDEDVQEKPTLMEELLKRCILLSLEIHSGKLLPTSIPSLMGTGSIGRMMKARTSASGVNEKDPLNGMAQKYNPISMYDSVVPVDLWSEFFERGCMNRQSLNAALKQSRHYPANPSAWMKLWDFQTLEDEEFSDLLEAVLQSFANRAEKVVGVVLHICGLLIHFSRLGLSGPKTEVVVRESKQYFDDILAEGHLQVDLDPERANIPNTSYLGLGFFERESPEFQEILDHLTMISDLARSNRLKQESERVLDVIKNKPDQLPALLVFTSVDADQLAWHPVLKEISPDQFVNCVIDVPNAAKQKLNEALAGRYHRGLASRRMLEECQWLKDVADDLTGRIKALSGQPSRTILEMLTKTLRDNHELLKAHKTNGQVE